MAKRAPAKQDKEQQTTAPKKGQPRAGKATRTRTGNKQPDPVAQALEKVTRETNMTQMWEEVLMQFLQPNIRQEFFRFLLMPKNKTMLDDFCWVILRRVHMTATDLITILDCIKKETAQTPTRPPLRTCERRRG